MTESEKTALYIEAWHWLTANGIIDAPFGCNCDECNYHINLYFS